MIATHQTVVDFFGLYTSERRELARWLGVLRESPQENDIDYGKRILAKARELGKIDELAGKVDQMTKAHADR